MTTTAPTAPKHRHAQNAERVCAVPFKSLLVLVGAVALATGLGQVILTTVGYFIAIALAMTPWQEPAA